MTAVGAGLRDFRLPLDEELFTALNGLGSPALDALFVAASTHAFGIASLCLAALWVLRRGMRRAAGPLVAVAVALTSSDRFGHEVLKPLVARLRPCFALGEVRCLVEIGRTPALPSLHAANAFAVATALGVWEARTLWLTLPLAALIAASRVGVGVHWPSDVLLGALFGAAVGAGSGWLSRRLIGRRFGSPQAVAEGAERAVRAAERRGGPSGGPA